MSSFRWGMIASPTPTNSQVTVWELRHLLFSPYSSIVLLTVLHREVQLGSACIPPHFGLSLCNALEQISPPYPIWKGTFIASMGSRLAWSFYKGCRVTKAINLYLKRPSYTTRRSGPSGYDSAAWIRILISNIMLSVDGFIFCQSSILDPNSLILPLSPGDSDISRCGTERFPRQKQCLLTN